MATYAVGDLQGCADEFFALLEAVGFGASDRLWLLGDLVNRGPQSLATLRRAYELRSQCTLVLGNHDLHLLAVAFGGHRPGRSDNFQDVLAAPDAEVLLNWLAAQPLMVWDQDLGYAMSHAGVLPDWSLPEAMARAQEVTTVLRGPDRERYFELMYGNEPDRWSDTLEGMARWRFITNVFTRMRLLHEDGRLDFAAKGALANAPAGLAPWFARWRTEALGGQRLLFGHWAALEGETGRDDIQALDTGCVWGRALTALCLETGKRTVIAAGTTPKGSWELPQAVTAPDPNAFERYQVGGVVRDRALGLLSTDQDWVVVGAEPEALLAAGYSQVGRDFPVFLHPQTKEEHALARTERKTGPGHKGFVVHAGPEVTLEEDLARRDLTINAMAQRPDGTLVDPYNGMGDLKAKRLRHVTDAFREDPLRVLRVARFAAQLPGFTPAPETLAIMRSLSAADALAELPAERVFQELKKTLERTSRIDAFFAVLADSHGLKPWFPEFIDCPPSASPAALEAAAERFAGLCWPMAPASVAALCVRLKTPNEWQQLAAWVVESRPVLAQWRTVPRDSLESVLGRFGAFRDGANEARVFRVFEAMSGVALADLAAATARVRAEVQPAPFQARGLKGRALGAALRQARAELLEAAQRPLRKA